MAILRSVTPPELPTNILALIHSSRAIEGETVKKVVKCLLRVFGVGPGQAKNTAGGKPGVCPDSDLSNLARIICDSDLHEHAGKHLNELAPAGNHRQHVDRLFSKGIGPGLVEHTVLNCTKTKIRMPLWGNLACGLLLYMVQASSARGLCADAAKCHTYHVTITAVSMTWK